MPLEVQVYRDGAAVDHIWDYFTLSCMYTSAIKEAAPDYEYQEGKKFGDLEEGEWIDFSMAPIYYLDIPKCPLVKIGVQTLEDRHEYVYNDERTLVFEAGDTFTAYRSSR